MLIKRGFTVIELLIVIVVIGILATVTFNSFAGMQAKAITAKRDADLTTYFKAILIARENTGKTLGQITNNYWSAGSCSAAPGSNTSNIEPKNLPKSSVCWTTYYDNIDKISLAAGINLQGLKTGDGNGNPYVIDENEGETVSCNQDGLRYFLGDGTAATTSYRLIPRKYGC
jgi:prepilin-type N-terminal cleavage/methylation domain-containing protein